MELPSKELMSEIYKTRCIKVSMTYETIIDFYIKGNDGKETVNIYELMHKMKKWVVENGGNITSGYVVDNALNDGWYCWAALNPKPYINNGIAIYSDMEFEAVAKACEWLLEQQ